MRNAEFGMRNGNKRSIPHPPPLNKGGVGGVWRANDAPKFRIPHSTFRISAFTLVELLIVIVVLGILFALGAPNAAESRDLKLQQAARMLAADFEFAENESIAHPDNPRLVKFNTTNSTYWIGTTSTPDTPVTDPISGGSYLITFGTGRGAGLSNVTISAVSLGGDSQIGFDSYGVPDQASTATVTLRCGTPTMTVQVAAGTGEVTIP